jgi:hypothetical protein
VRTGGAAEVSHGARGKGQGLVHIRFAQQAGGYAGAEFFSDRYYLLGSAPGSLAHQQRHSLR